MAGRRLVLFVVLVIPAAAQFDRGVSTNHHVRIHVAYSSGACDGSTRVELMQGASSVSRGASDKNCMVDLFGVPQGTYRMVISGLGFAAIETNEVSVTSFDSGPIEVNIPQPTAKAEGTPSSTSVTDLEVPKRAAKEFTKASRQMEQQQWEAAATSLQRAISIYPRYAAAYNNLGVVYARSGDRSKEADALKQAISIDSRYVPAYVNLARMNIAEGNFPEAESELKTATGIQPQDGVVLVLLTYAEYMDHHYEEVIQDCKRVHAMNDVPHAFAHWSAAFAFEQRREIAEAGEEFRNFVQEEPHGPRADAARRELANIASFLSEKD